MCICVHRRSEGSFPIYMRKRLWAGAVSFLFLFSPCASAFAQTLGPVSSFDELTRAVESAQEGDTILLSGDISAEGTLSASVFVHIKSENGAVVRGLELKDASMTFSGISFEDSLTVSGTSHINLGSGVTVTGSSGSEGLSFSGNGTLIVERGCRIEGGAGASGLSIAHEGGDFYSSIEGSVSGGDGSRGGAGLVISPLTEGGAVMITGSIEGGSGSSLGGHALNLYDLSGNAYITVDGTLQGGDGAIGGDGIQVVSASDTVSVGISGQIKGGQGESYGGNALILMNAEDASSVNLSGHFSGGDATGDNAQPGTSLHLVGDSASMRARIDNCILEDGKNLHSTPEPEATPLPKITKDPVVAQSPAPSLSDRYGIATPSEATPAEAIPE